ncbi:MAG TPA: hypothetical protein PK644_05560, partial [bacterium]|nr:hypothetical protein [bacterium]
MDNFLVFWFVSVPLIFCRLLNDVFLLPKQVLLSGGAVILFVCLLHRIRRRNYNFLSEPFFWPLTAIVLTRIFS